MRASHRQPPRPVRQDSLLAALLRAYRAGAEEMRERAAEACEGERGARDTRAAVNTGFNIGCKECALSILALPLDPEAKP